jgi:hypothetical protein
LPRHARTGAVAALAALAAACTPGPDAPKRFRPADAGTWTEPRDLAARVGGRWVAAPPELMGLAVGRAVAELGASALDVAVLVHVTGAMGPAVPHFGDALERLDTFEAAGGRIALLAFGDVDTAGAARVVVPFEGGRAAVRDALALPERTLSPGWGARGAAAALPALGLAQRLPWRVGSAPAIVLAVDDGFGAHDADVRALESWVTRTGAQVSIVERGRTTDAFFPRGLDPRVGLEVVAFAGRLGATVHSIDGTRNALDEVRALAAAAILDVPDPRRLDLALIVDAAFPREALGEVDLYPTLGELAAIGARIGVVRIASVPGATATVEVVSPLGGVAGGAYTPPTGPDAAGEAAMGRAVDLWVALAGAIDALDWADDRTPYILDVTRDEAVHVAGSADEWATEWTRAHHAFVHVVAAR